MYGFVITIAGRKLLAKRIAGESIEITRVVVGKGDISEGKSPVYFTDLVEPVAQATSTPPVAKENTVSFIVEYRSDLNGGLKEGFWIKEFGVFARDGEEEILLYYATLEDFPQYVNAYKAGAIDIRRYPVSIVLADGVDVTLSYPAIAFVTEEKLRELIETETIPYLEKMIQKTIQQTIVKRNIVIPIDGWLEVAEGGGGGVYIDIIQEDITEEMIPIVSIVPNDMEIAKICGMSATVETIEKGLRFYAQKIPSAEINASLLLLRASAGIAGSGTGSNGGMDIEEFYRDYVASNEEVEKVLDEVFEN